MVVPSYMLIIFGEKILCFPSNGWNIDGQSQTFGKNWLFLEIFLQLQFG